MHRQELSNLQPKAFVSCLMKEALQACITTSLTSSCLQIGWMRSARTDKGVSAVGQVVSLKMLLVPGILERVNEHLPSAIRVLGYTRVTGSFDARLHCDKRRHVFCQASLPWLLCQCLQLIDRRTEKSLNFALLEAYKNLCQRNLFLQV